MSISTFFGLQTSLRGLLAQQQAIDVTGHNIANANTEGYSRQEAVLEPTAPYMIPATASTNGAGAQLGSGVDVAAIRRVRDQFLDLQYRAQQMSLGDATARTPLDQVEGALAEPSDDGLAASCRSSGTPGATVANAPETPAARQAADRPAQTLTAVVQNDLDDQLTPVAQQAHAEYAAHHRRRRRRRQASPTSSPSSTERSSDAVLPRAAAERPARPPRPAARQALEARRRCRVTDTGNGRLEHRLRRRRHAARRRHAPVTWPQTLTAARRQARRAARPREPTTDRRLPRASSTPSPRPRRPASTRCTRHAAVLHPAGTTAADDRRQRHDRDGQDRQRATAGDERRRARRSRACAAARPTSSTKRFVARIGADVAGGQRARSRPRSRSSTRSTTAARASPASRSTRR